MVALYQLMPELLAEKVVVVNDPAVYFYCRLYKYYSSAAGHAYVICSKSDPDDTHIYYVHFWTYCLDATAFCDVCPVSIITISAALYCGEANLMLTSAFTWFRNTLVYSLTALNFSITLGDYTFGLLDFLVITFLLGVLVRNFVHTAR